MNLLLAVIVGLAIGIFSLFMMLLRTPKICPTPECKEVSSAIRNAMNGTAEPCDNFYNFACGDYNARSGSDSPRIDRLKNKIKPDLASGMAKITLTDPKAFLYIKYYLEACKNANDAVTPPIIDDLTNTLRTPVSSSTTEIKDCVKEVIQDLPVAVHAFYAQRLMGKTTKESVDKIAHAVVDSLKTMLQSASWLKEDHSSELLDKLGSVKYTISHPNEFLQNDKLDLYYKNLVIESTNVFMEIKEKIIAFKSKPPSDDYGYKKNEYPEISEVKISYDYDKNRLVIPSGILQRPFYEPGIPNYLNYASLGHYIADTILQAFLTKHSTTYNNEEEKCKKIYEKTSTEQEAHKADVAKELVRLVGSAMAADVAYDKWHEASENAEAQMPDDLGAYSQSQMLWLYYAHYQCRVRNPKVELQLNSALANVKDFTEDWGCAKRNMDVEPKCEAWSNYQI